MGGGEASHVEDRSRRTFRVVGYAEVVLVSKLCSAPAGLELISLV